MESIFQILDFGDILDFETVEERGFCGIEAVSRLPQGDFCLPAGENIVYRALSLFRSRTGFDRGIRISLEKRVPLGGGLGGGSSDAASTLAALDMLAGTGLSLAELRDMALCLGSDVPFFLADPPTAAGFPPALSAAAGRGGAAWVSGRGERIFPVETPPGPGRSGALAVVLVNPGFPSPTGEAFRRLDAWRSIAGGDAFERDALIQALAGDPRNWPYRNDFFPVLSAGDGREAAAYRRIISALREGGADFAGLSGAGSTCFGVFKDKGVAKEVTKLLLNEWFFVQLTFFLARSAIQVLEY